MHIHDHSSPWQQEPGDHKAHQLFEEILLGGNAQNEQQEALYQLIRRGMDEAMAGHIESAEGIFSLARAREQHDPRWEAQVLHYAAAVFERSGNPERALEYGKKSLALFQEHGPLRMEASVGIFLARQFYKTGQAEQALLLLREVFALVATGLKTEQISLPEGNTALFRAYHEMGHTFRLLRLLPQAAGIFEKALELARSMRSDEDAHTIIADLIDLHLVTGRLSRAAELGEGALRETDGTVPQNLTFLSGIAFNLGLLYLLIEKFQPSLDRSRAAYAFFKSDRATSPPSPLRPVERDTAFVGKLLVNMGSAYQGLGHAAPEADCYPVAVAYWRLGEELLARAGAKDVEVPRRILRLVRQSYPDAAAYGRLLSLSEPFFQSLRAEYG